MNSNYEMNKQLTEQRLQARYHDEAAQHRLSKQGETAVSHSILRPLRMLVIVLMGAVLLATFSLVSCGGQQVAGQPIQEADSQPLPVQPVEPTAVPAPTTTPLPTPEPEPEKIGLGHDAWLLVRGLPEGVTLDSAIDLEFKREIPDSRNFDYVQSEILLVNLTQNGEPTTIDNGIVEFCAKGSLSPGLNEKPVPYYWDTNQTPLVDGRPLRVSTTESEPDLVVCMMVEKSGAYGLVSR
ncbi:MAG: hypothetical protein D6768_17395 [Chloroflexi bacterium]|nr:MAG: hypothetical protein D6768_17395 [Chloroflexota bacterium]